MSYTKQKVNVLSAQEGFDLLGPQIKKYRKDLETLDQGSWKKYLPRDNNDYHVVEIGCGGGRVYKTLPDSLKKHYIGLDISLKQLQLLPQTVQRVHCDVSHQIPLEENSCDIVLSIQMLIYLDNYGELFQEVARILKPGGRRIIVHIPRRRHAEFKSGSQVFKLAHTNHRYEEIEQAAQENYFTIEETALRDASGLIGKTYCFLK